MKKESPVKLYQGKVFSAKTGRLVYKSPVVTDYFKAHSLATAQAQASWLRVVIEER